MSPLAWDRQINAAGRLPGDVAGGSGPDGQHPSAKPGRRRDASTPDRRAGRDCGKAPTVTRLLVAGAIAALVVVLRARRRPRGNSGQWNAYAEPWGEM
jgi:hypothetical protein